MLNGAKLVQETEPDTKAWFALKEDNQTFGIFDVFHDSAGQTAHFQGKVAKALQANSNDLIASGWDNGVVSNIHNFTILGTNDYQSDSIIHSTKASYILLKALPGKENQLANMLTDATSIITKTEPKTLFWLALQYDVNTFAIFDTFIDSSGREAHFSGVVANALMKNASDLVQGGWDNGVLQHIHNFDVLVSV